MQASNVWIVKLGGSLAQSPNLPAWLNTLSQTKAIIIPGGGPFADAVRQAQAHWHFDDATAHHMAILAMRQYGRMLTGLCPRLLPATTLAELTAQTQQAKVWLPLPEWLDDAGIPASWDITSDSLAAWLAGQVRATDLLLVKSIGITSLEAMLSLSNTQIALNETDAVSKTAPVYHGDELVNQGWVDPVFPAYAARNACRNWLCGPEGYHNLPQGFAEPARYFAAIQPHGRR